MKILHFSSNKHPLLTFEAEHTEFAPDNDAYVVQANGAITFQDTPALESLMHSNESCLLYVKEDENMLLSGRFFTTFLVLEEEMLVVRLTTGE